MAIVFSILSIVISTSTLIFNVINERKKIATENITNNRINWIGDVRNLLKDFIEYYINSSIKNDKNLIIIKNKLALYMRNNVNSYSELLHQIDICIQNGYNENDCNRLITASQNVLSEVWIRMKREAGISLKEDLKYEKMFNNI